MKVWMLVITMIWLNSPEEKLPIPSFTNDAGSLDEGRCRDHHCLSLTLPDNSIYRKKEECDKVGEQYAWGPRQGPKGGVGINTYKCVELEINWMEEQTSQKRCPPELQEDYQRALHGMRTGNRARVRVLSNAVDDIIHTQKSLGCQFD